MTDTTSHLMPPASMNHYNVPSYDHLHHHHHPPPPSSSSSSSTTTNANTNTTPHVEVLSTQSPTTSPSNTNFERQMPPYQQQQHAYPMHPPPPQQRVTVAQPSMGYRPIPEQPQVQLPIRQHTEQPDEPLYVNAKQYHRILKRRAARAKLEEMNRVAKARKPYLHESRHRHAMRRPRGPGGRFLTAAEVAELEKAGKLPSQPQPKKTEPETKVLETYPIQQWSSIPHYYDRHQEQITH